MEMDKESLEAKNDAQNINNNSLDEAEDIEQKLVNLLIKIIVKKTLSDYNEKSN